MKKWMELLDLEVEAFELISPKYVRINSYTSNV